MSEDKIKNKIKPNGADDSSDWPVSAFESTRHCRHRPLVIRCWTVRFVKPNSPSSRLYLLNWSNVYRLVTNGWSPADGRPESDLQLVWLPHFKREWRSHVRRENIFPRFSSQFPRSQLRRAFKRTAISRSAAEELIRTSATRAVMIDTKL